MFSLPLRVSKSIDIAASPERVYESIGNFAEWVHWSPWLRLEDCPSHEVEGDPLSVGHKQSWSGKWIGSGTMALESFEPEGALHYDLSFLTPWKSKAKTSFTLSTSARGTSLTWSLHSSLPIFLFTMKKSIQAMIGLDYKRGLRMLKEYLETGKLESVLTQNGETKQSGFHYYGIRRSCKISEIDASMHSTFNELAHNLENDPLLNRRCCIYHNFDPLKNHCDYTAALICTHSVANPPKNLPEHGAISAHRCLQVEHLGSYQHLSNAWASVMMQQQAEKKKPHKSTPFYEIYENSPGDVESGALKTLVCLPVER